MSPPRYLHTYNFKAETKKIQTTMPQRLQNMEKVPINWAPCQKNNFSTGASYLLLDYLEIRRTSVNTLKENVLNYKIGQR